MQDSTRRKFLAATGAGAGAAVVGLSGGAAEAAPAAKPQASRWPSAGTRPVVAYVQDPKVGALRLMVGEREVVVHDRDLVARILDAAGEE